MSALLTQISWSNHLHILSKTKGYAERTYYLEMASRTHYSERQFARIIDSGTHERARIAETKLSALLTQLPVEAAGIFKDSYVFEFLNIADEHKENDLRTGLVTHLKQFLLELGPDFSLIGQEYPVQVGMKDFRIDLLMHHRGLNCLVAFELKVNEFMPADLGQLQFYLEVLDRDIKKDHENPSIGILICKSKDEEVVKYAMNRNVSPTVIADYETKLINKDLLRRKLQEITSLLSEQAENDAD